MRCSFGESCVEDTCACPGGLSYRLLVFKLSCFIDPDCGTFLSSPEHSCSGVSQVCEQGTLEDPGQGQMMRPSWSQFLPLTLTCEGYQSTGRLDQEGRQS